MRSSTPNQRMKLTGAAILVSRGYERVAGGPGSLSLSFGHRRALRMIAFVVSVNGQRVGTIGVGDSGVLGAHVSWSGHSGEPGNLDLGIGGVWIPGRMSTSAGHTRRRSRSATRSPSK